MTASHPVKGEHKGFGGCIRDIVILSVGWKCGGK